MALAPTGLRVDCSNLRESCLRGRRHAASRASSIRVFAGAVANTLRESSEGRVAATAIAAGTAWVVVQLVLTGVTAALAHSIATDADAAVVRTLFNLTWVLDMMGALPIAAFVLAVSVGLRRTQMIPQWLSWGGIAVAVLLALRSTTWARDGFWSPTGEYLLIVIPLALLWILITSIVLVRSAPASTMTQPAPSAPMP